MPTKYYLGLMNCKKQTEVETSESIINDLEEKLNIIKTSLSDTTNPPTEKDIGTLIFSFVKLAKTLDVNAEKVCRNAAKEYMDKQ